MSRCFPYPPPGYERNGVSGQALIELLKIELLKLQKQRDKAKKESRREKKREKKKIANGKIEKRIHSHEKRDKGDERSKTCQKSGHHQKREDDEVPHLEKSSLTEEFEQPISSQNLYDSSDNTKNCNKRRKHSSPPDGSHNHGTITQVQLPKQTHRDPEGLFGKDQPCSSSGSMDDITLGKFEIAPRINQKQPCSTSTRIAVSQKVETATTFSSENGHIQIETQFRDFLDNWLPPPIQIERTDFDDQEWLFETKQNHRRITKTVKADSEASCCRSPALWARALHLPEIDLHVLPYTVPF